MKTGRVVGVNGNLVNVQFDESVIKNEVGYILVGDTRLKGEVIRITDAGSSSRGECISILFPTRNGISLLAEKRGRLYLQVTRSVLFPRVYSPIG